MEANAQPSLSFAFTTTGQAKEPPLEGDEQCYMAPHGRDPGGAMGWTQVPIGVTNSSPTSLNLKLPAPVPSTSKGKTNSINGRDSNNGCPNKFYTVKKKKERETSW